MKKNVMVTEQDMLPGKTREDLIKRIRSEIKMFLDN